LRKVVDDRVAGAQVAKALGVCRDNEVYATGEAYSKNRGCKTDGSLSLKIPEGD
jgi:hypothetical protein